MTSRSAGDERAVSVDLSPQHTVYQFLLAAARRKWVSGSAAGRFADRHRFALLPLTASQGCAPNAVVPSIERLDESVESHIDILRDYPESALLSDLEQVAPHTTAWNYVAREPRRWINAYIEATQDGWRHVQPHWNAMRPVFEREVERIGTTSVRGQLDVVLNSLSSRLRVSDNIFQFHRCRTIAVGGRRLILAPSLAAPGALLVDDESPHAVRLSYSVRESARTSRSTSADRLAALVGPQRSKILRVCESITSMTAIANALDLAPSTISRHCDQLEKAGLIVRRRNGKSVRITLTDQGSALLTLIQ